METHILVCDDEASVREVVSVVLGMVGYEVETASDGNEALQMIREQPGRYKLVMTDHKMRPLDGLGLVRELRTDGFAGRIVVLSGSLENADVEAYSALAVDGIMLKPFDFGELRRTVSGILSESAAGKYLNSCNGSVEGAPHGASVRSEIRHHR